MRIQDYFKIKEPKQHRDSFQEILDGNLETIKEFHQKGLSIDGVDKTGQTALIHAVKRGDARSVRTLQHYAANPNMVDDQGKTALIYAVEQENPVIAEMLITAQPNQIRTDLDIACDGKTALRCAVDCGNTEIVTRLLLNWANTQMADKDGVTPLMQAAKNNEHVILHHLALRDAESMSLETNEMTPSRLNTQDNTSKTALFFANADGAGILLEHGADPNVMDQDKKTALSYAMKNNDVELSRSLVASGARFLASDTRHAAILNKLSDAVRESSDHDFIFTYVREQSSQALDTLLPLMSLTGFDMNSRNSAGETLLTDVTTTFSNVKSARKKITSLLHAGVDIHGQNSRGESVLNKVCASYPEDIDMLTLMIDGGAELDNKDQNGMPPMGIYLMEGNKAAVQLLLDHGANPDARDKYGNLVLGRLLSSPDIVAMVLDKADVRQQDLRLATLAQEAVMGNHIESFDVICARNNFDIHEKLRSGGTILDEIIKYGRKEMLEAVLHHKEQDVRGYSQEQQSDLLLRAAVHNEVEMFQSLVDFGLNPLHRDENGNNVYANTLYVKGDDAKILNPSNIPCSGQSYQKMLDHIQDREECGRYHARVVKTMAARFASVFDDPHDLDRLLQAHPHIKALNHLAQMIELPESEIDKKYWAQRCLQDPHTIGPYIKHAPRIQEILAQQHDILDDTSLEKVDKLYNELQYLRRDENPALSAVLFKHHMSERSFNEVLDNLNQDRISAVPDLYIDGHDMGKKTRDYYMTRLPNDDYRGLVLGRIFGSCQHVDHFPINALHNAAGRNAALNGATSDNGGFYVVFKRSKETLEDISRKREELALLESPDQLESMMAKIEKAKGGRDLLGKNTKLDKPSVRVCQRLFPHCKEQYRKEHDNVDPTFSDLRKYVIDALKNAKEDIASSIRDEIREIDLKHSNHDENMAIQAWSWVDKDKNGKKCLVLDSWEGLHRDKTDHFAVSFWEKISQIVKDDHPNIQRVLVGYGKNCKTPKGIAGYDKITDNPARNHDKYAYMGDSFMQIELFDREKQKEPTTSVKMDQNSASRLIDQGREAVVAFKQ